MHRDRQAGTRTAPVPRAAPGASPLAPSAARGASSLPCSQRVALRALCVGRHRFLSDHIARFFDVAIGLDTVSVVGLEAALAASRRDRPDVVICDYDLLATGPLTGWESDPVLSRTPVLAVSMTRRPHEEHLMDVNGIAGFLYLPTLTRESALVALNGARARHAYVLRSPFDRASAPSATSGMG